MTNNRSGDSMTDMIKERLTEAGHSDLAAHVVLGLNGRPVWHWERLDRSPSKEDVHAVHAAMLRAYKAHAPEEVGEEPDQFTRSPASWWKAIVHHQRYSRRMTSAGTTSK